MKKNTVVLGASLNPARYSHIAIERLRLHGHTVYAVGLREGKVGDVTIQTGFPEFKNVDTVTLYLSALNQRIFYNYIFSLQPKRIIFNPGAENNELAALAKEKGIDVLEACTLVLLSTKQY